MNGDGHDYFDIIPIPELPNLRQIQVEGDSKVSYVQVHIDPKASFPLHDHDAPTLLGATRPPRQPKWTAVIAPR